MLRSQAVWFWILFYFSGRKGCWLFPTRDSLVLATLVTIRSISSFFGFSDRNVRQSRPNGTGTHIYIHIYIYINIRCQLLTNIGIYLAPSPWGPMSLGPFLFLQIYMTRSSPWWVCSAWPFWCGFSPSQRGTAWSERDTGVLETKGMHRIQNNLIWYT